MSSLEAYSNMDRDTKQELNYLEDQRQGELYDEAILTKNKNKMITAQEARVLCNKSTKKYEDEITRIDSEIKSAAENGKDFLSVSTVHELAEQLADEYCIHGYTVNHVRGEATFKLSW